jgi:anthranilate synthase component 2
LVAGVLPDELLATAHVLDDDGMPGEIMALRHREWPIHGVQFHPESLMTPQGLAMLANYLQLVERGRLTMGAP